MNLDDRSSTGYGSETIYGTHEDSHVVMSEKVQTLAGSIYQEFERMISRYDEDVVKTLMPLLVNVLECLDAAYQTNQVHDVDLELLREDNEQLVTQYEREKSARKHSEQKLLEAEDIAEGERKELTGRLEALDSIVRMLELKHKNSLDHASRLEERENELKKEYAKLHERYTELFKTHVDYMERTKLLLSTAGDRGEVRGRLGINPMSRSSGPISIGFASLENAMCGAEHPGSIPDSPQSISSSPPSPTLGSELAAVQTMEQSGQTDPVRQHSQATSPASPITPVNSNMGKSQTKSEKRSANTLYQELSFPDTDNNLTEGEDTGDITGSWVHPGEYASSVNDNYFGMGKEVENLILENNELLATKNALNVVKDDLIVKVDELTGEQEILREEVANLSSARQKLREKVSQLEEDLRHLKEAMNSNASGGGDGTNAEDEADVPLAQRKRFTRVEMARVLMERNQYKERFMELQDAVRWTEMVRASRVDSTIDKKSKQSIWKFFSNLFSTGDRPQRPLSTPHLHYVAANQSPMRHSRTQADFLETQVASDHVQYRRNTERREQFRQVRAHVRKEDGRTQAYGWSLPGKTSNAKGPSPSASLSSSGVPVPVPVFCRPLSEAEPGMTLLCAAGVDMTGGVTSDGGCMVGASVFYGKLKETKVELPLSLADEISNAQSKHSPEIEEIDRHIQSTAESSSADKNLSSLVWICSSGQANAIVMVIDAINPADILESFTINDKHILCVASVPGATDQDYQEITARPAAQGGTDRQTGNDGDAPIINLVKTTSSSPLDSPIREYGKGRVTEEVYLSDNDIPTQSPRNDGSDPKAVPESGNESPPLAGSLQEDLNLSAEPGIDAFTQEEENARSSNGSDGENLNKDRKMSTVLGTMWLGTKSGNLFVHSAVGNWGQCLARVKLNDAILSIVHCSARCIVALADGSVAVFSRLQDGSWDFSQYHTVALGDPKCSVRCLTAVGCTVWCGYRNKVLILEPRTLNIVHTLEAHPRKESQVRQMAWLGEGVWVSIKMDSTLRLYHAHTYHHLQDVDIEPYVSKMLGTGKLGFSLVRITALLISSGRLWIGTSNGVVISVPLSEGSVPASVASVTLRSGHTAVSRCSSSGGESVPYCSMAHAQLSFHGHREAVVFFVAVPGAQSTQGSTGSPTHEQSHVGPAPTLVMSGGEGYIDFRIADSEMEDSVIIANDETAESGTDTATAAMEKKNNKSHLIVWQVAMP